jgi:hypothetical protein
MRTLSTSGSIALLAGAFLAAASACNGGDAAGDEPSGGGSRVGSGVDAGVPGTGAGSGGSTGLPCDVDKVLATNCRSCHGAAPQFGAPMPLVTHADLLAASKSNPEKKVFELVSSRTHDPNRPMPPAPVQPLDATALGALDAWIKAGAPAGTEQCNAGGGGSIPNLPKLSCTSDQSFRPKTKIKIGDPTKQDIYICYGVDVPVAAKRHITAGAVHIDNTRIVHHVILFETKDAYSTTPQECNAGGAGGNSRFITGWAPGGGPFELPPEAGYPQDPGTRHYMVQVHYNNAQGLKDQEDASGYDVCTTEQLRANDADTMASGTVKINIPARTNQEVTCDYDWPQDAGKVHIVGGSAHMHKLGRKANAILLPKAGGGPVTVMDVPAFDFSTGGASPPSNVDIQPGDTLRTMCGWQNNTDATVKMGEGTGDEMCFNFMMYYPRITKPGWQWITPAVTPSFQPGKCKVTTTQP